MKPLLYVAAASVLFACSGAGTSSDGTPDGVRAASSPADDSPPPCPSSPSSGSSATSGPKKTPSPTDACEGAYDCLGLHNTVTNWLHSDGVNCYLGSGTATILYPDGRLSDKGWGDGTWKGDATSFDMTFPNVEHGADCTRSAMTN